MVLASCRSRKDFQRCDRAATVLSLRVGLGGGLPPVAIQTGHLTVEIAVAHYPTIVFLANEAKANGEHQIVAVLYHELLWKSWAQRVERNDSTLKMEEESAKVQERTLVAARHRVSLVQHLLQQQGSKGGRGPVLHSPDAAESALAKQAAAAEALTKRANNAAQAMAGKQRELEQVQATVAATRRAGGVKLVEGPGAGGEEGLSNGKRKSKKFFRR